MNAIETTSLTKRFGKLTAVDKVSLSVRKGETFGLLGPNGAGKTTLISMLVTTKHPTSGSAKVNGFDVVRDSGKVRASIGIVFQDPSLDEELTARENLELHAVMYGVERADREQRMREALEVVELSDRAKDLVKTFSGGMRRRLEIARSLLHYPKVLFLDEPTLGLDPQTREHVWQYIRRLKKEKGITIVLTTHYLDEADSLCDRIAIIDRGRIVVRGSPAELKNSLGGDIVEIACDDNALLEKLLRKKGCCREVLSENSKLVVRVSEGEKQIPKIIEAARSAGLKVSFVNLRKPSLDDVFLHHTGRAIREEGASAKDAWRMRLKAGRRP
ncbi:MAG: ATP-binding cassette domain-containing protein [Candidatus Micrarchaeia archaeon]|jgi:ABC-2 type transport system ATP-binding protein